MLEAKHRVKFDLKVTLEDMHRTNQLGLTDGITNIFLEGLKDLSVVERPIHCVDKKRGKQFYFTESWEYLY